jgi:membrane associated rhomboid family serine protease
VTVDGRKQALPIFTMVVVLIGVCVVLQLWLLSASLEGSLAGERDIAVPATAASAALFALSAGLLLYVRDVDRRVSARGKTRDPRA